MQEWIIAEEGTSYFQTQSGIDWTPIGQNDAISWPQLQGLYKRKDYNSVVEYFKLLNKHGVTCMRIMLEYCHTNHYYLEKPAGNFKKNMIQLWDDLFQLAEIYSIRFLITPFDTFWMWRRWKHHPYNSLAGGTCSQRSRWLLCPEMRAAVKNRLAFITNRWGGSGTIFAWDLWNEIRPAHASSKAHLLQDFVEDVGGFLKDLEIKLYGKSHLQTLSIFGHQLLESDYISSLLFRNRYLDFASTHFYEKGTIDSPKNTLTPAFTTAKLVRQALSHISDSRPFLDTEHGPITRYSRNKISLPEDFDDEYFKHMQWTHLAAGGCGGGMRWPYRQPHELTKGMRASQLSLFNFTQLVSWKTFHRRNMNLEMKVSSPNFFICGSSDGNQALFWLLRNDSLNKKGMMKEALALLDIQVRIPDLEPGSYTLIFWNTAGGYINDTKFISVNHDKKMIVPIDQLGSDLLVYVKRQNDFE